MRVTPRGSTSIDVSTLMAERVEALGSTKLRGYPLTSCNGKLQNSKPSSEYPPAKPRMPCAEIYLFGCVSVVDQTGRSDTCWDFAGAAVKFDSCAKLKLLSRRSIASR